jgi:hypothetical protein
VPQPDREEEDAVDALVHKHADKITATLGCFDRVLFKGYLPFGDDAYRNRFVDGVLYLRRKEFFDLLAAQSDALIELPTVGNMRSRCSAIRAPRRRGLELTA